MEKYDCHICRKVEDIPKYFRTIEPIEFRGKLIHIIKMNKRLSNCFSNYVYYSTIGSYETCQESYCDSNVFICNTCFMNENNMYMKTFNLIPKLVICKICNDLKEHGKKIIFDELDKISTNGYNTFGNIREIITGYII